LLTKRCAGDPEGVSAGGTPGASRTRDLLLRKRNAGMGKARIQLIIWQGYENCWDLLEKPTSEVPVRLPGWIRQQAQEPRVGLPAGHPWNEALPQW
jgi:hypothetical protein